MKPRGFSLVLFVVFFFSTQQEITDTQRKRKHIPWDFPLPEDLKEIGCLFFLLLLKLPQQELAFNCRSQNMMFMKQNQKVQSKSRKSPHPFVLSLWGPTHTLHTRCYGTVFHKVLLGRVSCRSKCESGDSFRSGVAFHLFIYATCVTKREKSPTSRVPGRGNGRGNRQRSSKNGGEDVTVPPTPTSRHTAARSSTV